MVDDLEIKCKPNHGVFYLMKDTVIISAPVTEAVACAVKSDTRNDPQVNLIYLDLFLKSGSGLKDSEWAGFQNVWLKTGEFGEMESLIFGINQRDDDLFF